MDCRPWSRESKKKWQDSTIDRLKASKTIWPIPQIEQVFLPDFKIKSQINEYSFKVGKSLRETRNFYTYKIGNYDEPVRIGGPNYVTCLFSITHNSLNNSLELICNGVFGKVYKVEKLNSSGDLYAMKILEKSSVVCENGVQQVKNEVQIQSLCGHHPFIVNCPFFWQNRNQLFIVSEYVGGGELLKLLQKYGPLPEELCRLYFAELVIIIDFLHNAGVIYRDIKPENILLDDHGHLQLIDFGLSKWLPLGCHTSTICGTTQYMAPEVLESEPYYSHAVDWWSAGVLLFQMLTNQYPPKSHDEINIALGNVSKGATDMVIKLLETNQQYRLKSFHQIKIQSFFHNFNFSDITLKKHKPNELLKKLLEESTGNNHVFSHFEEFDD